MNDAGIVFVGIAIAWSVFQGIAGWCYGLYIFENAEPKPSRGRQIYGAHHAALYFVCSLAGFAALGVVADVLMNTRDWGKVSAGSAAVIAMLSFVAISGVSGMLARLLYQGKIPKTL